MSDLRVGIRHLLKSPGFTAVAVLTLALGIGANTGIFSVVYGVLLRPLDYPRPDRIVRLWSTHLERGWTRGGTSMQNFEDWRSRSRSFQEVAVYNDQDGNLIAPDQPEKISYSLVTPGFFSVLGVPPQLGRGFDEAENQVGRDNVAVLSDALWRRALGADPAVIGSQLTLDGKSLEIVGVMPPGFEGPTPQVQLWKPFGLGPDGGGPRDSGWVYALGRLRDPVTRQQAQSEMSSIASALEDEYPAQNKSVGVFLEPLLTSEVVSVQRPLLILWGAVGLVLLIACANVANLLLARSTARSRELSIRAVLGAVRGRLLKQLLVESLLLSLAGSLLGTLLVVLATRALPTLSAGSLPRVHEVSVDTPVLLFSAGLALVTVLFFGLLPAWRASKLDLNQSLKEGGRSQTSDRGGLRSWLVRAEVALTLVLMIGAGLLIQNFVRLTDLDPGFDPGGVLTFRIEPPMQFGSQERTMEEFLAVFQADRQRAGLFWRQLQQRLESIPGVESAAAINRLPLSGNRWGTGVAIEGKSYATPAEMPIAFARSVTPGYFSTLGIPLLRGRPPTWSDSGDSPLAAVINRALAESMFAGEDPIGQRLTFQHPGQSPVIWYTVVGIVADVHHNTLTEGPRPIVYTPMTQSFFGFFGSWGMDVTVRAARDLEGLLPPVLETVRDMNPLLPVFQVRPLSEVVGNSLARQRFQTSLLGFFAALALALASAGVFGVVSYSVSRRTREIGTRMAVGASRGDVLLMIFRQVLGDLVAGVAIGLTAALLLTRYLDGFLHEMSTLDPLTFAGVPLLLSAVALTACLLPARRGVRINPIEALRYE